MTNNENHTPEQEPKPKWKKIEETPETPFATKPVEIEDTGEFKPLPWSTPNQTLKQENLVVENTTPNTTAIVGETPQPTPQTQTIQTQDEKQQENQTEQRTSVYEKLNKQEPTQNTTPHTQPQDTLTETAATLPKIFNDNAQEPTPQDFQAPIEINETETTMIRRRSLMGESRKKAEEGYDETHVRLAWQPLKQEEPKTEEEKLETILEGATVYPSLPSRAPAHWWSTFLSILLIPLSGYLLNDGMSKLGTTPYLNTTLTTGTIEILAATIAIIIVLIATQFSSVGITIIGTLTLIIGTPFLIIPAQTHKYLDPIILRSEEIGGITNQITTYLTTNATNGTLFYFGTILIFTGIISHTARRHGRKEQQIRNDLGLVGIDDRIAKKAKKMAAKLEKAEAKAQAKNNKKTKTN